MADAVITPPAPPAAPTTPPAAPTPPPSAAPSTPPPSPSGSKYTPGKFDDLDTLGDQTPPSGKGTPSSEPPKGPEGQPTPPAPAGGAATPDPDAPPQFKTNKEMRDWAIGRHKIATENEKKAKQLEEKIKELEARGAPESVTQAAEQQLANLNKRIEEYESQMRLISYERSQEYATNFRTPIDRAITAAHKEMEELQVHSKGEDGEDMVRAATAADFNRVYNTPGAAGRELAKKMFGDDWQVVWQHRNKIKELSESASNAIEDHGKKWKDEEQQRILKAKSEGEASAAMWRKVNEDLSSKYAYFRPSEKDESGKAKDPEGDELLAKGFTMVDAAFGEARSRLTLQERVILDAQIRNRAAAFAREARRSKMFEAEIVRQAKLIEELRGGSPGGRPQGGGGNKPATPAKDWDEAFDNAMPD